MGFVEGWAPHKRGRGVKQCRRLNAAATGKRGGGGGGGGGGGEQEADPSASPPRVVSHDADIEMGVDGMCRLRRGNTEGLLKEKKLMLVLDLDNTLLHSIDFHRTTLEEEYMAERAAEMGDTDDRSMFMWEGMVTKLRPHARDFLREASQMFDLYIYTMGVRSYALQMARFLDPHGLYFSSNKVISREHCTVPGQKGLDAVPVDERIALVLDDKPGVWARTHLGSLIAIERYDYFGPCHGVCDVCSGMTLSETPEIEPDRALRVKLCLLQSVHRLFFSPFLSTPLSDRDVRHFLPRFL